MDKNRALELKYFARQYGEFKGMRRNEEAARQIEMAAAFASAELYPWLIENVTKGKTFEQMQVPCGRVQFYKARTRFFEKLDELHT